MNQQIPYLHHFGIWLVIIASLHFGNLQDVIIRRLDGNQGPVCPGQRISFQCTTVGSAGISWRSNDFIGSSLVQINFLDSENLRTPKRSTKFNDTVAVLTSKLKGSRILTSMLTVTVTSRNLNPSVTCVNDDHGNETTFSFNVIGDPGVPTTNENPVLREDKQGSCLLTVSWMAVANVSHYIVSIDATLEINETLTFTSVVVPECRSYGVRVQSVNQCGDESPYSPEILPDMENIRPLVSFDSPDSFTTDDVPVCTNPPREECDDCSRPSTISVVLIVIAVLIFVVALILFTATIVLIIWYTNKHS